MELLTGLRRLPYTRQVHGRYKIIRRHNEPLGFDLYRLVNSYFDVLRNNYRDGSGQTLIKRFERQLHVLVVICILRTAMHVVHVQKIKERYTAVPGLVLFIVLKNYGQLQ